MPKKIAPPQGALKSPARKASSPAPKTAGEPESGGFPVVGIGASAGGLKAFEEFFSAMPAAVGSGMAFVLVQHLDPNHASILPEILQRFTKLEVHEVRSGVTVRPGHVYIIPPNRDMAMINGVLQLLEPTMERGHRMPIDYFFRSLAQDAQGRAACIVLSGTGSDGMLGLREVKAGGGIAIVQSLESAEYDGMPRSAISTGLADYVLAPAEMPGQLNNYFTEAFLRIPQAVQGVPANGAEALRKIHVLLRSRTGHDFSHYKEKTIARRIQRRMAFQQVELMDDYVRYLQQTPDEVEWLFRDFLIGVTSFFRDPEVFEALGKSVAARMRDDMAGGETIRVWVPGCSTGEEAYSIAIVLHEQAARLKKAFRFQIFATDIDAAAINKARAGLYPASIAADLTPERFAQHFILDRNARSCRIHKSLRDMMIFSEQDVIKDPPFSKLDLISCRNLLIYMDGSLQKKLIPLFHYALRPRGLLLLGTSETVGDFADLFSVLERHAKIYQRKEDVGAVPRRLVLPAPPPVAERDPARASAGPKPRREAVSAQELTMRALLRNLPVSAALVTAQGDILYLHGRTGRFLEPSPGTATMNILKMAREGLHRDLALAMRKVAADHRPVTVAGLRVKTNGDFSTVNLSVQPLQAVPEVEDSLLLVILEDVPSGASPAPATSRRRTNTADARLIEALQKELRSKEEYLQSICEELETANEELQSSNEEMQSMNEELQSTNEELETSKEELQSMNEELVTLNAELQSKVQDLSQSNNDLNNLMGASGIGTVFVDHGQKIVRFTPAATEVINLISSDIGRPLGHIATNLPGYTTLVADVQSVLNTLAPVEVEAFTQTGACFLLHIRPYRTLENVIEGAVITFTDITLLKNARAALQESESLRRLAVVVLDANDAILVQDMEGRILAWNPAAVRIYGWTEAEALAKNITSIVPEARRQEHFEKVLHLSHSEILEPYRSLRIAKDGRTIPVLLTATALLDNAGKIYAIATTERPDPTQPPNVHENAAPEREA